MAIYWDTDVTLVGDLPSSDLEVRTVSHVHISCRCLVLVRLKYCKLEHFEANLGKLLFFIIIFMACVCSQCDAHADWLIVGHYSSVMPMGRLWAYKRKKSIMKKNHCVNCFLKIVQLKAVNEEEHSE